ncbi:hypothetical protein AVEN_192534-1 [Araneus ventricosus]|uniref:Uncharacterized protein n=1 Tax=Araneus ventricosus TaxID=182803 RepID=A0A4Y2V314_ARAVE|nr:hypothetical protein AVEN_192534-1 [Araneus ventricosus]
MARVLRPETLKRITCPRPDPSRRRYELSLVGVTRPTTIAVPPGEIMKIMCLILMFVLIMLVQQGKSFTGTGCPRLTMVDCPQGYSVGCCDSKECSNGEFCCLVNSRCEIKCMKPDANGPESPFAEDRDTCMAYAKPPEK